MQIFCGTHLSVSVINSFDSKGTPGFLDWNYMECLNPYESHRVVKKGANYEYHLKIDGIYIYG